MSIAGAASLAGSAANAVDAATAQSAARVMRFMWFLPKSELRVDD
jgi:hypothetical protein